MWFANRAQTGAAAGLNSLLIGPDEPPAVWRKAVLVPRQLDEAAARFGAIAFVIAMRTTDHEQSTERPAQPFAQDIDALCL